VLFHGRVYHDQALAEGVLPVPAVYMSVDPAFLLPTLLAVTLDGAVDIERVSIDSVENGALREVYAGFGRSPEHVRTISNQGLASEEKYTAFHRDLYESGVVSGALTTMGVVAQNLQRIGVPVARYTGTFGQRQGSLRRALTTVAALASGTRIEMSQLAVALVSVSESARPAHPLESSYWQQEMGLELHKIIIDEARLMQGTVASRTASDFMVTTTLGDLRSVTGGLQRAPFLDQIQRKLGVEVDVGIGLGLTPREAEENALAAVSRARVVDGCAAIIVGRDGSGLSLPVRPAAEIHDRRSVDFLQRVLDAAEPTDNGPVVLDAETVARLVGIAPRSARRNLESLVGQGLAWPMQSASTAKGGRPRYLYRLVREKL
jgi:hypothetical protein